MIKMLEFDFYAWSYAEASDTWLSVFPESHKFIYLWYERNILSQKNILNNIFIINNFII